MDQDPVQVLRAANRASPSAGRPRVLVAGATGVLGNEVLQRLVSASGFGTLQVLAREPITAGMRGLRTTLVPSEAPDEWPLATADIAVVLFEPPRMFHERERALWAPAPEQLVALAQWLRRSEVRTLAIVLPHAQGRLPEALKRGLASLDEHAVAALGFERLLILRSAQAPAGARHASPLAALAHWMLGAFKYFVPASEQPVRASRIADLLLEALRIAPPGIHVAAPEVVWQASQQDVGEVARRWLG